MQKNNSDINNQTWYTQYRLSKTVKANNNVVSSMIWGCQWDATLRWMQTSSIEKVKNFATNSAAYGNYWDNSISYVENGETKTTKTNQMLGIPTGSSEATKINNIYDMAGNMDEWTLEACNEAVRTTRGGDCNGSSSSEPASYRQNGVVPQISSGYCGSRLALYVAL